MGILPKRKPVPAFKSPTFPPSNVIGADMSLASESLPVPPRPPRSPARGVPSASSSATPSIVRRLSMAILPSPPPIRLLPQARESVVLSPRMNVGYPASLDEVFGLRLTADEVPSEEDEEYRDSDGDDEDDIVVYSQQSTHVPKWLKERRHVSSSSKSSSGKRRRNKHHSGSSTTTTAASSTSASTSKPPSSSHTFHTRPRSNRDLLDDPNSDDSDSASWDFQFDTRSKTSSSLPPTHPLAQISGAGASTIDLPPQSVPVGDGFDALDVMADHLFRYGCEKKKWFSPPGRRSPRKKSERRRAAVSTGVSIRATTGIYRTFPPACEALDEFEDSICVLNPEVAFKINSPIVTTLMTSCITPNMVELTLTADTRIQILDDMIQLRRARKHQYAAFIRDEGVLVVWADDVSRIIPETEALEACFIDYIWRSENNALNAVAAHNEEKAMLSLAGELKNGYGLYVGHGGEGLDEKDMADLSMDPDDVELRKVKKGWRDRPVRMYAPIIVGMSIILCLSILSIGVRRLIKEYMLDGKPARFGLLIFLLPMGMVLAFATSIVALSIWQIIGPVRQMAECSAYFSSIPPRRTTEELPHVTVWLPIFKESLEEVIVPTIESLKRAIMTYERQGGSVGILVCDDGLQLMTKREADQRRKFYYDNDIAYVARPGNGVNGFVRRGRFKKASNLNFGIRLSLRVEEILDEIRPAAISAKPPGMPWNDIDEHEIYEAALEEAVDETDGQAWARGNIRMGSIILLIDSDTRVPEDCFLDAVSEMSESPNVAIIQHASGVMQVAHHFFENGIAHFTRMINVTIGYSCANGENSFDGRLYKNAFFVDDDGLTKVWSEDHVSEDFSIALMLQMRGYVIRWATYSEYGFREGVSLTCDDELNRWQKYAYGASEIMFNPFRKWLTSGPITPLFRSFLFSDVPLHYKASMLSYLFSYYAIGSAWPLAITNYFVVGFNIPVDLFYQNNFNTTFVCVIIFSGITNLAAAVLRYRIKFAGTSDFVSSQFKHLIFFGIFFLGISMHVLAAIGSHMVGFNMTWGATVKTVTVSNFFKEVPALWQRYWISLVANLLLIATIVITSISVTPVGWRVSTIEAWVPLGLIAGSHVLYPIVLNPWLLQFSF